MTIISTAYTETSYSFITNGQTVVVTPTGSIVDDIGDTVINSIGNYQQITMDGFIYCSNDGYGIGIAVNGAYTSVAVNALLQADTGVEFNDDVGNSLTVGSQGTIESLNGAAAYFTGGNTDTAYILSNAGELTSIGLQNTVVFANGGLDLITNSGLISGDFAVSFVDDVGEESLENSGTITGGSGADAAAIRSDGSSVGVNIVNSGLITDGGSNGIDSAYSLLSFDDVLAATSTLDNKGTISGSGYVIQSLDDILLISNSGSIHGGLFSDVGATVHNSGLWAGQAASAVTVFELVNSGDIVTNSRAGIIDGGILLGSGGNSLTNAGSIDGAISFLGAGSTDSLTNSGEITGSITLTGAKSTFTNSGTVTGSITFSGANSTFTDTGTVTGNVKLGATNSMVNHGQIYGDLTAGSTNSVTNKGVIHGDITLGAHDTIYVGNVTGAVNAKTNDLLEFSGNFGNQTINKFLAGSGSTADIIQFATNDFSSFAKVQAASTQQGSDVVIRLDATDSITLTGVTLSSLVAANFTFT